MWKVNIIAIMEYTATSSEETKSKLVYKVRCALILYYFVLEYIHDSGTDLLSIVSPRMLK